MRALSWLLILAGLVAGPGYYLYARYFTGALVAEHLLAVLADAQVARHSPAVRLEPDMSPVRFVLRVSAEHGPSHEGAPRNRYRALIQRDGATVAESDFELVSTTLESSVQEHAQVLATLAVAQAGDYRLALEDTAQPQMRVTALRLEVRRNVHEPDKRVVWGGVALLALAVVRFLAGR